MEAYFFDELHLGKFLALTLDLSDIDVPEVLIAYGEVLKEVFLIRATSLSLRLGIRFLDFTGCCGRVGKRIEFNAPEYWGRLLDAGHLRGDQQRIVSEIGLLRKRGDGDIRHYVNGEDFVRLLEWDQRDNLRRKGLRSREAVVAALRGCLEFEKISEQALFRTILLRTRQASDPWTSESETRA